MSNEKLPRLTFSGSATVLFAAYELNITHNLHSSWFFFSIPPTFVSKSAIGGYFSIISGSHDNSSVRRFA